MRTSAEVYGKTLKEYMISMQDVEKLQKICYEMLCDFHEICESNNIKYSLAFGTLLGAVRHKGFIPWDDDVDVMIYRKDYKKFCEIINREYSDKYYIYDCESDKKNNLVFPKLILKDTKIVEVATESKVENGIFIDLFLLENMPIKFLKIRKILHNIFKKLASLECDFKYPSKTLLQKSKENSTLKKYYGLRRFCGFFASIMPIRFWVKAQMSMLKGKKDSDTLMICGDEFNPISKEMFDNSVLLDFKNSKFYCLGNYDEYLKDTYGNYMVLPPEEKRERHIIIELDYGKYNY